MKALYYSLNIIRMRVLVFLFIVSSCFTLHSKPISDYRSFEMDRMITICFGDNGWADGLNDNGIDYAFHLIDASLTQDGKIIIEKGVKQ